MRARIGSLVVVVFVLATFVWGTAAQSDRGSLAGTITDASGAVHTGRLGRSQGSDGGHAPSPTRAAASASINLIPGEYTVTATLQGLAVHDHARKVTARAETRVALEMRVGSVAETVTVTGDTPAVDVQSAMRQASRRRRQASRRAGGSHRGPRHQFDGRRAQRALQHRVVRAPRRERLQARRRRSAVDVLGGRGHGVLRQRPPLPQRGPPSRAGRGPHRGADQLLPATATRRREGHEPFAITTELSECPWNPRHRLVLIGIQGRQLPPREPAPRNLVFLIDVSGSMTPRRQAAARAERDAHARRRAERARPRGDRRLRRQQRPRAAVDAGHREGADRPRDRRPASRAARPTARAGIQLAYQIAREHFIQGGVNRVMLATDGDFNVGVTSQDALVRLIEQEREVRRVPVGARLRHRQPEGLDDGEAGRQGERQLRLHRLAARGAQGARRASSAAR